MRNLAVLVIGIWMVSSPWATLTLAVIALTLLAIHAWGVHLRNLRVAPPHWPYTRVEPRFDFSPKQDHGPRLHRLLAQVGELERDLDAARGEIAALRSSNEELHSTLRADKAASQSAAARVHARVGLSEGAPDWLVVAARRAYRKRLHPDAHPESFKGQAHRRFQEAEQVFAEIAQMRGTRS